MFKAIPAQEFVERRLTLLAQLEDGCAVLIQSASMAARNSDVEYLFRQDSTFFYFTGFDEPDALALLIKRKGKAEYHLFCQPRNPEMEIWYGYRCGEEGVVERFGADFGHSNLCTDEKIPELLDGINHLYYSLGRDSLSVQVNKWLSIMRGRARAGVVAPSHLLQLDEISNEMRLIKSESEQQMLRGAAQISADAHIRAMQACKDGVMEFQLDAHIQHHFAMNGAQQAAYPSIVGGGKNACVLHYIDNNQALKDGDLVLIDAGAEYQYYAGDITRTFPVSGKFSPEQRALYELTLAANLRCIEMIAPGVCFNAVHECAVTVLTTGLVKLGLLSGEVDALIEQEAYKVFFMHKLGHWLGMDVHDVGSYKIDGKWRELEAGMVMTVEPGIYVALDNLEVESRWRGIGIRIEDDVLVTATGCEVMSSAVPKSWLEIEALMAQADQA